MVAVAVPTSQEWHYECVIGTKVSGIGRITSRPGEKLYTVMANMHPNMLPNVWTIVIRRDERPFRTLEDAELALRIAFSQYWDFKNFGSHSWDVIDWQKVLRSSRKKTA